ncbi:ABC transporter membrane-spanning protein [Angustibacter peucedani]
MSVAGVGQLLRFHLRRDRLMLLWWVLGSVLLYWSQAVSTKGLYPTQAEFDRAAASMAGNAAFVAMAGPARALNTLGGQVAWQASAFGAIVAGLMSMFLVGRHTRAEEESGRDELVRSSAVGREAPLAAAAVVVLVADLLLGGLVAASLAAYGLPVAGSVALGVAAGLAGVVFGAVALVAAQLTSSTRAVYGITGAAIAAAYVARAVGDVGPGLLSWLSPIGWGQAMRAYAGERWWPALLSLAAAVVLAALAVALFRRRDVGAGVVATRSGPSSAPRSLHGALGLAWRLQRGSLVGWALGLFLAGLSFGAIGDDVTDLVGDSQFSQDVFGQGGGSLLDGFYATLVLMLGLISAGFAVQSALRARAEEAAGRAEALLATALPRLRWAGSHLLVTVAGTVVVVLLGGLGLGVGYALATGDGAAVGRLLGATGQEVAPVLVLATATWLLYGLAPRWATAGWLVLGFCAVVLLFGASLQLPGWVLDVSPFHHLALVPAEPFAPVPLVVLLVVAVGLGAAGFVALRRRDVR